LKAKDNRQKWESYYRNNVIHNENKCTYVNLSKGYGWNNLTR
jgi:hypothetical protein